MLTADRDEPGPLWRLVTRQRRPLVVLTHLLLWSASFLGAFLLRYEFDVPWDHYGRTMLLWLGADLACRSLVFWRLGLFRGMWRYSGMPELKSLFNATTASTALFAIFIVLGGYRALPRSVFVTDWFMSMILVGGLRFGIRALIESRDRFAVRGLQRRPILVVGAGDAGALFVREMLQHRITGLRPVGFLDDDPAKAGQHIHGVRVFGPIAEVERIVAQEGVEQIVVAMPSMPGRRLRSIVERCEAAGVEVSIMPDLNRLMDASEGPLRLRPVRIEDLLRREPVALDDEAIASFLRGERVLVTGAGGSIGAELVRQILRHGPERLVLVDQAETPLDAIHRALERRGTAGTEVLPRIADIRDERRMAAIFETDRPSLVFHAAAHKHVPMVERNPEEAIKNNVLGTRTLADLSARHGVHHFVMISTDKAVNPSSVMGVTKRLAEIYIQALSTTADTRFETVRFGNVLGSAGSVVPIFERQIAEGGPVTVTHPDMRRFFMTIPEACQLVLQAATMGRGGEIFILDMGEPVRIVDLARDLIALSGLKPDEDIRIELTGMRPGEKLFEELSVAEECAEKTRHPMIYTGRQRPVPLEVVEAYLARLVEAIEADGGIGDDRSILSELVPEYQPPSHSGSGSSSSS